MYSLNPKFEYQNSKQFQNSNFLNYSKRYLKFPNNPLPLRRGRERVGVAKIETIWFPLPFIPSHIGEGRSFVYKC
jgi:hypothetical protein